MSEYRVNLDIYNGPLDLLLYLIRREEVDIHDIPIARITAQYVAYVEMLHQMDPNLAGDFLVMAATLMEIKTRLLLPSPEMEGVNGEDVEFDPRADLVRQLLQYKAFKDAASDLAEASEQQSLRFVRRPGDIDFGQEKETDLDEVQVWDLFDAFRGVLESIGKSTRDHEVIYDDTPIELHADDIMDRLQREGPLTFRQVFEGRQLRSEIVGLFIAMLELCRLKKILAQQPDNFGEIRIEINPNPIEDKDVVPIWKLEGHSTAETDDTPPEPLPPMADDDEESDEYAAEDAAINEMLNKLSISTETQNDEAQQDS